MKPALQRGDLPKRCGQLVDQLGGLPGRQVVDVNGAGILGGLLEYARAHRVEHIIRNLDGRIGERNTYGHDLATSPAAGRPLTCSARGSTSGLSGWCLALCRSKTRWMR